MHIHLPKPLHGWREFIGEVGIIVVGVLIALGAEQAVEAFHWAHQIEAGEGALREDARNIISASAWREAQSPCLARRLDTIADQIDRASATGRLPAVGQLGSPSWRIPSFKAWDSVVASQVAVHLPRESMLGYASIASLSATMTQLNRDERQAWTDMYTIVGPGRAFGDAEQAATRAALSRALILAKDQRLSAEDISQLVSESGLLGRDEIATIRRKAAADYAAAAREGIMCKPLADAPKAQRYGQGPSPLDLGAPFKP